MCNCCGSYNLVWMSTNDRITSLIGNSVGIFQVSKCEKFGYGFMVTMVASTAPGMVALYETGTCISEMPPHIGVWSMHM